MVRQPLVNTLIAPETDLFSSAKKERRAKSLQITVTFHLFYLIKRYPSLRSLTHLLCKNAKQIIEQRRYLAETKTNRRGVLVKR
jgi:hypothetical protein